MKMISLDSIPEQSAEDIELARTVQAGRSAAISWMGLTRKSSGRVSDYLKRQGFDLAVIPQIIASLQEDRTIDDERLARKIVQQRQDRQAESRQALVSRLASMGIELTVIEHVLTVENQDQQDRQSAVLVLKQRFGGQIDAINTEQADLDPLDFYRKRQLLSAKAARFLSGRGFSEAVVLSALRQEGLLTDSLD